MNVFETSPPAATELNTSERICKRSDLGRPGHLRPDSIWFLVVVFAGCVGSTFISYRPYVFSRWDDAEYMWRAVRVSRAFWSRDVEGLGAAMVSNRPPVMTLLGVPWGPLNSWDDVGKCFVTLAGAISLMASTSFYLVLRIGVRPAYLIGASACVALSIGPVPPTGGVHADGTSFMADTLFAWTTTAAVLLIPFEADSHARTMKGSAMHGALWGVILSLGTLTKLNFLYFVALILPVLLLLALRRHGVGHSLASFSTFWCCSAPVAIYLLRYGKPALENARASSFGSVSELYYRPLFSFLRLTMHEAPGLAASFLLITAALTYWVVRKRTRRAWPALLALLIVIGFMIIVLAAPNKQIRYAFPTIVALPFLLVLLLSDERTIVPRRSPALAAGVVFCGLFAASMPMKHRPDSRSLTRSLAVLAEADASKARSILLATDSPTLNISLLRLAAQFSEPSASTDTLAYQFMYGTSLEDDIRILKAADLVVFQDAPHTSPRYTNQRVSEYEEFVHQNGCAPFRVEGDVRIFPSHCSR